MMKTQGQITILVRIQRITKKRHTQRRSVPRGKTDRENHPHDYSPPSHICLISNSLAYRNILQHKNNMVYCQKISCFSLGQPIFKLQEFEWMKLHPVNYRGSLPEVKRNTNFLTITPRRCTTTELYMNKKIRKVEARKKKSQGDYKPNKFVS